MTVEELTCEEIKARTIKMGNREEKEFLDRLSPETRERYLNYERQRVMQRVREFLSYLAESPRD